MITIYRFIIVISLKLPLLLTSKDFETMSLAPTQDLSREELDLLTRALNCYYLSDEFSDDQTCTKIDILKEKINKVKFSDFDVCQLQTLK